LGFCFGLLDGENKHCGPVFLDSSVANSYLSVVSGIRLFQLSDHFLTDASCPPAPSVYLVARLAHGDQILLQRAWAHVKRVLQIVYLTCDRNVQPVPYGSRATRQMGQSVQHKIEAKVLFQKNLVLAFTIDRLFHLCPALGDDKVRIRQGDAAYRRGLGTDTFLGEV